MKTQTTVGQFVAGKNAEVIVKVADLNQETMMTVLSSAMEGMTIGITARMPVNKKTHIAEVEEVVADLNAKLQMLTTKNESKGEVKTMTNETNNEVRPTANEHRSMDRAARNTNVGRFQSHAETVAAQRFMDLGEYEVVVLGIEWSNRKNGPVGTLTVQLPVGYADVRFYDRTQKQAFWYDFCDFNIDGNQYGRRGENGQTTSPFNPSPGSGILTLPIWAGKNDNLLRVFLPTTEYSGKKYDVIRTRDIRFGFPHSDNNKSLEAALTAYVRFYAGEFVQANPDNRNGIKEDCSTCKFNMYVPGYDGMDNEREGYQNTLNTSDTIEMVQWGNEIPRRFCMVNRELVDLEVVKEVNELMASDTAEYFDENGNLRYLRPQEILVAGRPVNKYAAIREGMQDQCVSCPFYHNNQAKTEQQIAKEKAAGKEYVSKYWSENARAERMSIQTLVHNGRFEEWVAEYPGAVDGALDFRVYGIGGLAIYGCDEVAEAAYEGGVLNQVPMTEAIDEIEGKASKIINYVYYACFNMYTIEESTLNSIISMLDEVPQGISPRTQSRLDSAIARLQATIQEYQG